MDILAITVIAIYDLIRL